LHAAPYEQSDGKARNYDKGCEGYRRKTMVMRFRAKQTAKNGQYNELDDGPREHPACEKGRRVTRDIAKANARTAEDEHDANAHGCDHRGEREPSGD
jgi:hypothetical protein